MKLLIPVFLIILGAFTPPSAPFGDENIGLEKYTTLFEQEDISYDTLPELTKETLQTIGKI